MNDSFEYERNRHGERIEDFGGIVRNLDYWDCDCEHDYIHPISRMFCLNCDMWQDDCPSSRDNEVHPKDYYYIPVRMY